VSAIVISLPPVDPSFRAVGERLRELRLARGISESVLAAEMRIEREILVKAERGRVRLTAGQLYAATLALRLPMRLLFEPSLDVQALRKL
jgi:transcriptional regulator with XRE-family HTH domain